MSEDGERSNTTRAASLDELHMLVVKGGTIAVVAGPEAGVELRAEPGGMAVVGSGASCDLRLTDPLVSRRHLEIHGGPRGVRVVDCGSRNGTFFHGARLGELLVTESAEVNLGGTRLAIRVDGEAAKLPFSRKTTFGGAIAHSEAMRHVFKVLELAAGKDVPVLLEGESGTGKEVLANGLHAESHRKDGPFVVVDCGSIAPAKIEIELFGAETSEGAFERASGGMLFLDDFIELPLDVQPKLLRAIESRVVRRIGGKENIAVDVRVVVATSRSSKEAVRLKELRQDLFYRLAVVHVVVPRLAERREDVIPLAERFLRQASNDASASVPEDLAKILSSYTWPGNVRELRNVVERFATLRDDDPVLLFGRTSNSTNGSMPAFDLATVAHLPYSDAKRVLMDAYHRAVIPRVVTEMGGNVPKAAERLGMSRTNLYRVLQELGGHEEE